MPQALLRKKNIDAIVADIGSRDAQGGQLHKVMGVRDLTFMGIAAVIGAGIFSTVGSAAYDGGPGIIFLFLISAVACGFTALCYAEFASRVPGCGSAYTYSYVSFGEIVAWVIGWALILEYAIGNIVVAISWSAYFNNILKAIGINLPDWLTVGYQTAHYAYLDAVANHAPLADLAYSHAPEFLGGKFIVNLPAFLIVVLVTMLAYVGINESRRSANFMVGLKLAVLAFVAATGIWYIFSNNTFSNWSPFLPNGMGGVLKGVSSVFFAYIGFDAISTTAEECRNPQRDLPRGMIYSLLICTLIYVVTALVITGVVKYSEFKGVDDPLAYIFDKIHWHQIGFIVSVSAVIASTSVLLVFQIGQPRIWMSMSRDGLLPKRFSDVNPRFKTPGFATIVTGLLVCLPVLVVDDKLMTDLTSIGTLFAFVLVCGGVLCLPAVAKSPGKFSLPQINGQYIVPVLFLLFVFLFRERILDAPAHFGSDTQSILFVVFVVSAAIISALAYLRKYSFIPVMGVLFCLYLMIEIPAKSWMVFFLWMFFGLSIYFLYSRKNSKLVQNRL